MIVVMLSAILPIALTLIVIILCAFLLMVVLLNVFS
jgi:hypothetical protein